MARLRVTGLRVDGLVEAPEGNAHRAAQKGPEPSRDRLRGRVADLIPDAEKSWHLLWDPKYAGKIAVLDAVHDTPVVAAVLAGVDPFNMSDADIEKVRGVLQQQRPLVKAARPPTSR